MPSYLLDATLADFLPPREVPLYGRLPSITEGLHVPPTHHLLLFPPPSRLSALLPDGTDPEQSPGEPYIRRMWAGGRINFRATHNNSLRMIGQRASCLERISDVTMKGITGDEKIYVTIERRVSHSYFERKQQIEHSSDAGEEKVRKSLMKDKYCSIIEHRNIVFMRERSSDVAADAAKAPGKMLKPPQNPTFSHTLTPTAALLFRFSALTFNAHRIHLDKEYCQKTEGHRNLLVHGPLSLVLMVELLSWHLASSSKTIDHGNKLGWSDSILEIEYRNLAPLYADEPMRVCGKNRGKGEWVLWIEGRDGGCAVKGKAQTSNKFNGARNQSGSWHVKLGSTARDAAAVPDTQDYVPDEPDAAPRHTLEDPEEYGKMPLAS
ncbi:hypothetical protein MMC15_003598 [Xylographa vitiligo]|nr:hypothetical protein [Xylographa vitiligo]